MKARRAVMQLGNLELDVFQLPDGSYRMSQTQIAEAVGLSRQYLSRFLSSKWLKALPGLDRSSHDFDRVEYEGRGRPINAVPLDIAFAFWLYQVTRGNKRAIALAYACGTETLTRRADRAFGVVRPEQEYNQILSEMANTIAQLDRTLQQRDREIDMLQGEYATDDIARENFEYLTEEVRRLSDRLRELGEDPYG